jgi:hypothetical protein
MSIRRVAGIVLLACLSSGCGSGRPATVPVKGTVTYQGEPVEGAAVVFFGAGRQATAETDAEGVFSLMTFEPNDGAIPGEYTITIAKMESAATPSEGDPGREPPKTSTTKPKSLIPTKYGNPQESSLKETVTAGAPNEFTFELTD